MLRKANKVLATLIIMDLDIVMNTSTVASTIEYKSIRIVDYVGDLVIATTDNGRMGGIIKRES